MLICIADSEYFNIALKAYINEPNSKPLDIKEILCYPFSGQSEMYSARKVLIPFQKIIDTGLKRVRKNF